MASVLTPTPSSLDILNLLNSRRGRTVKRIPKSVRLPAADKLSTLIANVCAEPDGVEHWTNLLLFGTVCMAVPGQRGGRRHQPSVGSKMIRTMNQFPTELPSVESLKRTPTMSNAQRKPSNNIAARVFSKLEDGDVRGAVRIAASDETLALFNDDTLNVLRGKHPPRHTTSSCDPLSTSSSQADDGTGPSLVPSESAVLTAVKSFPPGSAAGVDGLRPQHLKDMLSAGTGDSGRLLLARLTELIHLCLSGRMPASIRPVFCGASLCALNKKDGGLRPIAVGVTLRRLCAKVACKAVMDKAAALFHPVQLGCGISRAAEAAVHAARRYVASLQPGQALLKLDFSNAFNCISRDVILQCVKDDFPELLAFVRLCYADSSHLCFGKLLLSSDEGAQQGDPLGPLLFCLPTMILIKSLSAEFNLWYLDDGALGGDVDVLLRDIAVVKQLGSDLGLCLNEAKCELVTDDVSVISAVKSVLPNISSIPCSKATLLGAPIGSDSAVSEILRAKLDVLKCLQDRLKILTTHDAFFLLRNCFAIPKLLYILRTSPCFDSPLLFDFDAVLRDILRTVLNISLTDQVWQQATLPPSFGGLGIRLPSDISLPAYLSSVHACASLTELLLPVRLRNQSVALEAMERWSDLSLSAYSDVQFSGSQKAWDLPLVSRKFDAVMSAAQSPAGRARLLAAASPHSGDFLSAVPCSAVGTRMDDSSFRIAVALRLGASVCAPHTCICGHSVDSSGTHGLSCRRSAGRHIRHSTVNDLIKRALTSAEVPSRLEPVSLTRSDGKRPDGLTLMPWSNGRCLVWDFTCPDTLAPSHLARAVAGPSVVANDAEDRKHAKYACLSPQYIFTPVAVETLGALGDEATAFLRDVGRRIAAVTAEPRSTQFLLQRLSIAIQRGNAACVLGTIATDGKALDDVFYL